MDHSDQEQRLDLHRASLSDFACIDLSSLLADLECADINAIESALQVELTNAIGAGDEGAERALRVLVLLCTLHLQVDDPACEYVARWRSPERRSYEASDFRGDQNDILAQIAPQIRHPGLRARVSDVVWFNERKQWAAGKTAILAYSELVEKRIDGSIRSIYTTAEFFSDAVNWLHRGLQIASSSSKPSKWPAVLREAFASLYSHLKNHAKYVAFSKLSRLGAGYGLVGWKIVANDAEELAGGAGTDIPPWALHPLWQLAASSHARVDDAQAHSRCTERMVDQTLRNLDYVSHPAARASWVRDAIEELRQAGGFKERIQLLRSLLREYQEQAVDQVGVFITPVSLEAERAGMVTLFGDLTLPDALLQLAFVTAPAKLAELRSTAEKGFEESFFSSMFGSEYTDREGKVTARTPAPSSKEGASKVNLKDAYVRLLSIRRFHVVNGLLEPARRTVMSRFPLEERHFRPIVQASPFVPMGHEHLFGLGFARFWQGDYASAVHLLVPQIENSIRHLLLESNLDSSKMSPDLLQEDRSLSGLLSNFREEMDAVFGEDLTNELELLFVHKPGPAIRHELAHGKLYDALCYEPDAMYACWLAFYLVVFPLVEQWSSVIAPAVEASAF